MLFIPHTCICSSCTPKPCPSTPHSQPVCSATPFNTPDTFVQFPFSSVFRSSQHRLIPAAETFPKYLLSLTLFSTQISVPNVLSVFHFWVNVSPWHLSLYLVSRLPEALPVSVLEEPSALNSCQEHNTTVTNRLSWKEAEQSESNFIRMAHTEIKPTALASLIIISTMHQPS